VEKRKSGEMERVIDEDLETEEVKKLLADDRSG
jgi:hypothetical protein